MVVLELSSRGVRLMDSFRYLCLLGVVLLAFTFLIGAKVGKETTNSSMYHRDYKECIKSLPRDRDCVAVKVLFKEVGGE